MKPSKEASSETVSGEETTEEETLETVFFDNLTDEPYFYEATETEFCNYEIIAGVEEYKYRIKISNIEKGMVPWSVNYSLCNMYYSSNNDDVFLMSFGRVREMAEVKVGCLHPDVFRDVSIDEILKRNWIPAGFDIFDNASIYEFIEDKNTQYIYIAADEKGGFLKKDARQYSVIINNKDGAGAFYASILGVGKYYDDNELLRIIKNVNMSFKDPLDDNFVSYAEKEVDNGKSDYYLYYRNNSDVSKSSKLVVKGFERNRWVGYEANGDGQYSVQLLSKDDINSTPLVIDFETDANIEFLRSLNVKNSSEKLGRDFVEGSFSSSESDDDYSVYYAMVRDNTLIYYRCIYNKKNNTGLMAFIISSNNETDNAEEYFEILRNIEVVP